MGRGSGVRELLERRWFRWLFGTRLVSQCADGVFQASLASAVFFNPDHQTDPKQAAAGFVVLLLPYSLVGPFAGVFLDRWRRQRVLVRANLARVVFIAATAALLLADGPRGVRFYVAALAALSVNRFYLAALSASLPHVVRRPQLLLANAVTTTAGTFIAIVGLGIGLVIRKLAGPGDHGSAVIALASCVVYLAAAAVARRLPVELLGPHDRVAPLAAAFRTVVAGLAAGATHVWERRTAARALAAISGARVLFGMSTIGTLLLYRNYFQDQGVLRAGLVGLSQAFAASAVGYVAAAFLTPMATTRIGKPRWIVLVFASAAGVELAFGLPFAMAPLLVGACLLGFATQSAKICVDTIVQEEIADDFRGRVFSFYDTLFNLTFIVAAVVAAFVLPASGKSYPVVVAMAAGYAAIAAVYAGAERPRPSQVTAGAAAAEART
ncbi:MAG TPA: MFS transporter [Mycobacteriales bacterium]|nr:MFS transporter [Mycobacteriales bacterium]